MAKVGFGTTKQVIKNDKQWSGIYAYFPMIKTLIHQTLKNQCFYNPVQTHDNVINFRLQSKSTKS